MTPQTPAAPLQRTIRDRLAQRDSRPRITNVATRDSRGVDATKDTSVAVRAFRTSETLTGDSTASPETEDRQIAHEPELSTSAIASYPQSAECGLSPSGSLQPGDLVRFCNERDTAYYGMTGRIETLGNGGATVRLTTRAQVRGCMLHELARVPDAAGSK